MMTQTADRTTEPVLWADQVHITAETGTALAGCSFALDRNTLGLMTGPSGSGKTALGLACCGLLGDTSVRGDIALYGETVTQGAIDPRTGVVLENPVAQVSGLKRTVADELAFSLECRGVAPDEIDARTERMLSDLELSHLGGHAIDTLSGGELQRMVIGAALIAEPRFLFLDRPLTDLDQTFRARLIELLRKHLDRCGGAALIAEDPWLLGDTVFDSEVKLGGDTGPTESLPVVHASGNGDAVLSIEDISFAYHPDEPLIDRISCRVPRGGVLFLEGPNGAGKTTLAKLAAGLLSPTQGRIVIDGCDAGPMSLDERIRMIGFAPQNPRLVLCRTTVREELALAAKWGNDPAMLVPLLGLDRVMEKHPLELSRAEQKRLGIALAYGPQRKVVILDEPSQYQDRAGFGMVVRAVDAICQKGAGVMVISHDPRFSSAFPDAPVTRLVRAGTG